MGGSSTNTKMKSILTPEQSKFLNQMISTLSMEWGQHGPVYGGQIAPDASPLQQQAFSSLGGGEAASAISQLLSGDPAFQIDPEAREKLYGAEKASQMGQLTDTWKQLEERANFDGGSGRSGGLNRSMTQAAADTHIGLGRFYGGLSYADETARRAAAESAAQRQVAGMQATGLQLAAGGQQRDIAGQQAGEAYNKWLSGQWSSNPALGFIPQILGTQVKTPTEDSWGFGMSST
jgi:hypothetical protein